MNPHAKLVVGSTGVEIPLNCDSFRIGRSLDCDFVIVDKIVSRCHCVLQKVNGLWKLSDQSANGTMVNTKLLSRPQSVNLKDGDKITLNSYYDEQFIFRSASDNNSSTIDSNNSFIGEDAITDEQLNSLADQIESQNDTSSKRLKLSDATGFVGSTSGYTNIDILKHKNQQQSNVELSTAECNAAVKVEETKKLENEFVCSICSELFIKAVTLNCSHSFCKYCIETWRQRQNECPICRQKISSITPTLVLDNYIEELCSKTFSEEEKTHRNETLDQRKFMELANPIAQTSRAQEALLIDSSDSSDDDSSNNATWNEYEDDDDDDDDDNGDGNGGWDDDGDGDGDGDDDDFDWHFSDGDSDAEPTNLIVIRNLDGAEASGGQTGETVREVREARRVIRQVQRDVQQFTNFGREYWSNLEIDYGRNRRVRTNGNCFNCNQYGHYARNCPLRN